MKKFKGLLTAALLIITGIFAIIEVGIEVVYQLVYLVRRGYGWLMDLYIDKIKPIYNGKVLRMKKPDDGDLKIFTYDYEEEAN